MEYRRLGKSGIKLSALSLGSWITFGDQIDKKTSEKIMTTAYEAGVNFFDNAESYADGESERVMGDILKRKNWDRDTYMVSSKVFFGAGGKLPTQTGLNRKHMVEACHAALKRMQMEYLDIYFCHRPDPETPVEETVWTMHNLITQGKVLYWGTSMWSADEIMEAHMVARQHNLIAPVVEQPQYNMFYRDKVETEYANLYETVGLGTTIWSPLSSGLLTGKYNKGEQSKARLMRKELSWLSDRLLIDRKLDKVDQLMKVADDLGITMPGLALAWCLKSEHVSSVILGASKNSQLEENLHALDHVDKLTDDVMERIEEILENNPDKRD